MTTAAAPAIPQPAHTAVDVWPDGVPDWSEWAHDLPEGESALNEPGWTVWNVTRPTITPYLPERSLAKGTGIVVCPGGGFEMLVMHKEGSEIVRWLNAMGIAAVVLKYRLLPMPANEAEYRAEVARRRVPGPYLDEKRAERSRFNRHSIEDGRQSIRIVRQRAAEWGIDPQRLGIMGFSAGGTVAGGAALAEDPAARPNFAAPIYGAPRVTGSVPADAPPVFLAAAGNDTRAAEGSLALYAAWRAAGREAELHVYGQGGHGFGLRRQGTTSDLWAEQFAAWLRMLGYAG